MIYLFSDYLIKAGGIETYLHALSKRLRLDEIPFKLVVTELQPTELLEDLIKDGIQIYRQRRLPGDRWLVRQRCMILYLASQLRKGDWVFCLRQPMPELFSFLVRVVKWRGAKLAVSWMVPPSQSVPPPKLRRDVAWGVANTDAVISTNRHTLSEFESVYGYRGKVHVVPYHSLSVFPKAVPMPAGPPWKIGYIGRFDIKQKNLDRILEAVHSLHQAGIPVELHLYGSGGDEMMLRKKAQNLEPNGSAAIHFHGAFARREDLVPIMCHCHFFIYTSYFEGLPLSLLEMLQAGRFCVTSRVGGIPDLYEGCPEAGIMLEPAELDDRTAIERALRTAVTLAAERKLNPAEIRKGYDGRFDIEAAHAAWLGALGIADFREARREPI